MNESEARVLIALITAGTGVVIALINALFVHRPLAKVLAKIAGIEEHLGIRTDDHGKVLVLSRSPPVVGNAAAERQK